MSANENENEQRRALRVAVDLPARYRSGTISLDGRAVDLSQGGMFFASRNLDSPSELAVQLEIDLPDAERPLLIVGEVRWVEEAGMGICFTQIPIAERRRLANYVILRAYQRS